MDYSSASAFLRKSIGEACCVRSFGFFDAENERAVLVDLKLRNAVHLLFE